MCNKQTETEKHKRIVACQWQLDVTKLYNNSKSSENAYLCASCYIKINNFINNHDDTEQFLESNEQSSIIDNSQW